MEHGSESTIWHVAFLRAINVGGRVVKMERLRACFEGMGFANVATFIASGNVIFRTAAEDERSLGQFIENSLAAALGYDVPVFLRTASEIQKIAALQPFAPEESGYVSVLLLHEPLEENAFQKVLEMTSPSDAFFRSGREIFWLCRTSVHESHFSGGIFERITGQSTTARTMNTIRRLAKKYTT
jgi:uncharacterized protein (DUF1697 family)